MSSIDGLQLLQEFKGAPVWGGVKSTPENLLLPHYKHYGEKMFFSPNLQIQCQKISLAALNRTFKNRTFAFCSPGSKHKHTVYWDNNLTLWQSWLWAAADRRDTMSFIQWATISLNWWSVGHMRPRSNPWVAQPVIQAEKKQWKPEKDISQAFRYSYKNPYSSTECERKTLQSLAAFKSVSYSHANSKKHVFPIPETKTGWRKPLV